MIYHYLKVAVRHILKYKTQNLISIIGLSVGILCFSICLYCSRYIYDTNKCFTNHDRISSICLQQPTGSIWSGVNPTLIDHLQKQAFSEAEAFTYVSYANSRSYNIEVKEGKVLPYELQGIETDSLFFRVFTPEVLLGSWEAACQTPNSIVLARSTAERIFGDMHSAIGKNLMRADGIGGGKTAYSVQAVMADIPVNNSFSFLEKIDMIQLNDIYGYIQAPDNNSSTSGYGYALLRPGVKATDLDTRFRSMNLTHKFSREEQVVTAQIFGFEFWDTSAAPYFALIAMVLGILILLTGLLNFFQFLIGTFLNRRREYGIRKVAGCSTGSLFAQLSVQAVLISLFAFLITFCLIELLGADLQIPLVKSIIYVEPQVLMLHTAEYMGGILTLCLLLSLLTAWRVRKVTVMVGMNANTTRSGKHYTRNLLLGVQFFICFLFIGCTAALYMQSEKTASTLLSSLTHQEKSEILSIPLRSRSISHELRAGLIQRLTHHDAVTDYMLTPKNILNGRTQTAVFKEKKNFNDQTEVAILRLPQNFFDFCRIPFLSGRGFESKEEAVIDQFLASQMKEAPLGMVLYDFAQQGYTVRGVIPELCTYTGGEKKGNFCVLSPERNTYHCYLKCAPGKVDEVKAYVGQVFREMLPESVEVKFNTLAEDIIEANPLENSFKGIILFFSIVSLIITLLGVYSAITLDTERRQKEVAIRKVNGAGMKQIVLLFARLYITLLLVTAAIALPIVYVLTEQAKTIYTVFFDNGPLFWCGIFLFVAAVTTLTVLFRILKIARINPAEVIKNE